MNQIPAFQSDGILPPYQGDPRDIKVSLVGLAPYRVTIAEMVRALGFSPRRLELLGCFLRFRAHLRQQGITSGHQWVSGSFVDAKEEPGDVDVVTFGRVPATWIHKGRLRDDILEQRPDLFVAGVVKRLFKCDGRLIPIVGARGAMRAAVEYYAAYSRTKDERWRGFLEVEIDDDREARLALDRALRATH